ncbi:protein of unknown function [Kaistella jeonii]|uniref:DUF4347 domain-containing protein n=1 Tax=Kaistella jeonii TaxID=266749 RepID=A0A0C1F1Z8_9FLAO|nr:hypothetical protein OA86_14300 [Kaistella jeonii]SFC38033.1 protein of unknown function [Kaistella jeonii]VEI96827.1 Uncharacterised protein [Kaistella jeonii]
MNKKLFLFLAILCQLLFSAKNKTTESIYIDSSVSGLTIPTQNANQQFYQLFSHGRSGELFIENHWMNVNEIAERFKNELKNKKELYIYGCNFGGGKKGRAAIKYLEDYLNIQVNASTNITGESGDWKLEIGKGKNGLKLPNFKGNLQLDKTHYLNPLLAGSYNNTTSIQEEFIYLSTPSATNITVQMNYASGTGSPRISIYDLTAGTTTYTSTGVITLKNANPVRLQFVGAAPTNTIITPGTTPTTVPTNTGGTIISGNSTGLKFTSSDNFYVNYRARSTAQAGSMLAKGLGALGTEFRWGGSPNVAATTIADIGNMLSVMATEDNTKIVIDNIKTGTKFIDGLGGITLTGPTINKTLQKGDSFILYAPVTVGSLTIQDTGWLGAKIISDKNIAVAVGGLMQQGISGTNRDIGFDQLVPVNRLGLEYIVMQGNGNTAAPENIIIVSTVDNTKIYLKNGFPTVYATLVNAGDYVVIPANTTPFDDKRNMFVRVSRPAYVFHKIYGKDQGNTNSLMFIPPLSCFGEKVVDLIPASRDIGSTTYTDTEISVLAATAAGAPTVTENGTALSAYTINGGGNVLGNVNWTSYRYKLTLPNSKVKVSSTGTVQAELFGASGDAGFGGYFSGFGDTPSYLLTIASPYGYLCPDTGVISVAAGLGTYQWFRNDVPISGATTNTYTLNGVGDSVIATYYVTVKFPGGCSINSNEVTSDECPCTKAGSTLAPTSFTKMGISIRDKRSTANWPKDIPNGFIAMEANNKGFVITRIASPETAISNPILGMLVYDTTKDCLKLYNGTSWNCIKPTCN